MNKTEVLKVPKSLLMTQKIANITDTAVRIPFTRIKLGLDFLIGLIPGIGDAIMLAVAGSIIVMGHSIGMPKTLLWAMFRNSALDFILGLIPLIGDVVDIFYKSNQKNVRIMELWWLQSNKTDLDERTAQMLEQWEKENS
ncbi:DUF4112 domain-containing protein [Aliiglaciecola sp. M165]|uniref:DUF4112 domain-containing protein n=1 Tax=Aliiglaciecola sp. M165 TaxID=2593649 RepID=UPI00117E93FB|nr:DUF4112 domain-containing protein [Aliiglaciecola sp. M165]TRY33791.1 DUF4112 domain-containing protein [Aliiglaciecola sp. M165]